ITYVTADVGIDANVSVSFPNLYAVSFEPANLPAASDYNIWGINASFSYGYFTSYFSENTTGSQTVPILLPAALLLEHPFLKLNSNAGGTSPYYYVQFPDSNVIVSQNITQQIHFGTLYAVKITFVGMPPAGYLSINSISGGIQSFSSLQEGTTVTFLSPNGTFDFSYGISTNVSGAASMSVPFSITVSGAERSLNISVYNITLANEFSQSSYYLTIASLENAGFNYFESSAAAGQNLSIYLLNGTYAYQAESFYGSTPLQATTYGNFSVSGSSKVVSMPVPTEYYQVAFYAYGLPPGAPYSMNIYGTSGHSSVEYYFEGNYFGGNTYAYLPPGVYYANFIMFQYNNVIYFANNTIFTVTGELNVDLNFSTNAYLTFLEHGLPSGNKWSVVYNGTTYSSTSDKIVVSGNASRNLHFIVNSTGGYSPNPSSGSILAADQSGYYENGTVNFEIPVQFSPNTIAGKPGIPISTLNVTSGISGSGSQWNLSPEAQINTITPDPANGLTYIIYTQYPPLSAGSYIDVVNSSDYTTQERINLLLGVIPVFTMLDPNNGMLYSILLVSPPNQFDIASLNTVTNSLQITPINIYGLSALAVDQASGNLYAAGYKGIYELNPATLGIMSTVIMNSTYSSSVFGSGLNLFYSGETGLLYATGYMPNGLVVINPSDNVVAGNYSFNINVNEMDAFLAGSTIDLKDGIIYSSLLQYDTATGLYSANIVSFNISSHKFIIGPTLGQELPNRIAYDPYDGNIYMLFLLGNNYPISALALDLGQLAIYEPSKGLLMNYTYLGPSPDYIAINPANHNILVGNAQMGSVTVIGNYLYGYIEGTVNIPSASVTINGVQVQVSDGHFSISTPPGIYYVSAFARGFAPQADRVIVSSLSASDVALNLNSTAITYSVTGHVSPAAASVMFNGIASTVSSSGNYQIFVTPGTYTVSAFLGGYFPFSEKVDIQNNTTLNLELSRETSPESVLSAGNFTAMGFNVSISSAINNPNLTFEVKFNSSANGTILVEIPFASLSGVNLSDLFSSRVYIDGTEYGNFSITLTSNYTVILKVTGLSKDPTLIWSYGPEQASTKLPPISSPNPLYYIAAALAAIVVIAAVVLVARRRKS
ncbi:MAG: hypothetical protein QXV22_03975, partial [Thermoplasmataceae archaeon]